MSMQNNEKSWVEESDFNSRKQPDFNVNIINFAL